MDEFNNKKYITLKEAAQLFGYSSDYLGFLVRTKKIKGRRTYLISWKIRTKELVNYCRKRKRKIKKPYLFSKKLTLKQASRFSKYTPDYLGQLIRTGKIKGKKVKTQISWLVDIEDVQKYQQGRQERQIKTRKPLVFGPIKVRRKKLLLIGRRLVASTLVVIYLLSGIAPTELLLASIGAVFRQDPKTISLYSQSSEGDWQNPQNSQGPPELAPDKDITSFSESNSAVYQTGPLSLLLKDFDTQEDLSNHLFNSAQIKFSFAIGEQEPELSIIEEPPVPDDAGQAPQPENTTSSEEQTSLWNRVKQFFNSLFAKINSIVKKTLSIAKAEEEQAEPPQEPQQPDEPELQEEPSETESLPPEEETPGEQEQELPEVEPVATSTEEVEIPEELSEEPPSEQSFGEAQDESFEEEPLPFEETPTEQTTTTEATTTQDIPLVGEITTSSDATSSDEVTATSSDELIATSSDEIVEQAPPDPDILPNLDAKIIIWWSLDGQDWQILDTISSSPLSNALNNGYFTYQAPFFTDWQDITNLQIKFEGVIGGQTNIVSYLDSLWIEAEYEESFGEAPSFDESTEGEAEEPPAQQQQTGGAGGGDEESPPTQDTSLEEIVEESPTPDEAGQAEEPSQEPEEQPETEEPEEPEEGTEQPEEEQPPEETEEQPVEEEEPPEEEPAATTTEPIVEQATTTELITTEEPEKEKPTKKKTKLKIKDKDLIFSFQKKRLYLRRRTFLCNINT